MSVGKGAAENSGEIAKGVPIELFAVHEERRSTPHFHRLSLCEILLDSSRRGNVSDGLVGSGRVQAELPGKGNEQTQFGHLLLAPLGRRMEDHVYIPTARTCCAAVSTTRATFVDLKWLGVEY